MSLARATLLAVLGVVLAAAATPCSDPEAPCSVGEAGAAAWTLTDSDRAAPTWCRNPVFYQLMLLALAATLAGTPQGTQLGLRAAHHGIDSSTMGFVLAPLPLTCTLLSPWIGRNLSLLGLRRTLVFGAATIALSGSAFGVLGAVSNAQLFVVVAVALRIVFGIGGAAMSMATTTYWNTVSGNFSTINSVTSACCIIVGMLIPPSCTLLDARFGFAMPFVVFGGLSALMVAGCATTLPSDLQEPAPTCPEHDLTALSKLPRVLAALAVLTADMACIGVLGVILPFVFADLDVSDYATSWVFSGIGLAWAIGSVLSSHLLDEAGCRPEPLIHLLTSLAVLALVVLALPRDPAPTTVSLALFALTFAASTAHNAASKLVVIETMAHDPGLVPLVTGFMVSGRTLGEAFGNTIGGVLYRCGALPAAALTFATILAATIVGFIMAARMVATPACPDSNAIPLLETATQPTNGILGRVWGRLSSLRRRENLD